MIEMGARAYDVTLGRFVESDPIEGGTATNDYGYVADSIQNSDLSGEKIDVVTLACSALRGKLDQSRASVAASGLRKECSRRAVLGMYAFLALQARFRNSLGPVSFVSGVSACLTAVGPGYAIGEGVAIVSGVGTAAGFAAAVSSAGSCYGAFRVSTHRTHGTGPLDSPLP